MAAKTKTSISVILGVGLLALLLAGIFAWNKLSNKNVPNPQFSTQNAENDQAMESLTALSAQITRMKKQSADREADQLAQVEQLRGDNNKLLKSIDQSGNRILNELQGKIDALNQRLTSSTRTQDYPITTPSVPRHGEVRADGRVWFGGNTASTSRNSNVDLLADRLSGGLDSFGISSGGSTEGVSNRNLPVYTIPSEATLVNSRGLTAIIGRVPLRGVVKEPIPFKVITGGDNLVPNDLDLPEVEKAIWSGTAIGDATLECVTGKLSSVTFVFADGTISTFPDSRSGQSGDQGIAWISDQRGYPCIPGTYVSNAPEVMAQMFGAGFASGAASAISQANSSTTQFSSGSTSTIVDGSTGAYAFGQGAAEGFNEWSRYIAERARDLFDAVVVHPGHTVTINTNQFIPIDYQTHGRKLRHVVANPNTHKTGGLD